jgi:hypothetical protein
MGDGSMGVDICQNPSNCTPYMGFIIKLLKMKMETASMAGPQRRGGGEGVRRLGGTERA